VAETRGKDSKQDITDFCIILHWLLAEAFGHSVSGRMVWIPMSTFSRISGPVTFQPLMALTPLYNFSSDSEDLRVSDVFRLQRYTEQLLQRQLSTADICQKHLQIHPPDYILLQVPDMSPSEWVDLMSSEGFPVEKVQSLVHSMFMIPALNLFRELRLFKPGFLLAGDTFVLTNPELAKSDSWGTLANQRASLMRIDFSTLPHQRNQYTLTSSELPFLQGFIASLSPTLESLISPDCPYPELHMALELFGRNEGLDNEVLNLFTALEGLLTNDSTSELTYRLSMRVASLLGEDDESRKRVFNEMKSFYDLRSKIVHGSGFRLKPKYQALLEQVSTLREYVRRVILRIMALLVNGIQPAEIEGLLDDMVFDESARKRVYSESTRFIHIAATSAAQVY
jgi:hypothetical protein